MEPAHRVARNTGILYARMAITVFVSLYTTRLILGALGEDDFGIFNVVGGAIGMLMFLNNAMAGASQRFMSYAQGAGEINRQKQIFNVSIVLHVAIAIVIFFILEGAGYFLFNGILKITEARILTAKLIYQVMIVSTLFSIISVPYDAVINAHENMLLFAILGIVEAALKLLIAFFILNATFDRLEVYGILMAVLSVFLFILRQAYCRHYYTECSIQIRKYFNKSLFKEMTSFAGWTFLGSTTSLLGNYGQGIVLNMFFGTIVNTAQGISGQVSGQLGAFASTMLKALNPVIDKSEGAGNRSMMLRASMAGTKISFFLLMLFYIPVLIEMPYIFKLWLKNVPDYAVIFCRLLLIRNLVEQLYTTLTNSIAAVGNIKKFQIYSSSLYILPLIVSYFIFLLHYPPYFLYYVFLLFSILSLGVTIYFAKINCDLSIPVYFRTIVLRCFVTFIIIFSLSVIPVIFMNEGIPRLVFVMGISLISYLITIWFVGFANDERAKAHQILKALMDKLKSLIQRPKAI